MMARGDLVDTFDGEECAGVRIGLDGLLAGEIVLVFERENANTIAEFLVSAAASEDGITGLARSGIEEAGNITTGGFIAGSETVLGTTIDHSLPRVRSRRGPDILRTVPDKLSRGQQYASVVDSTVRTADREVAL